MIWKAFGTHGGEESCIGIMVGKRKDCHHLEDLSVDVRIILRLILKE
jgi:hypothetical protein